MAHAQRWMSAILLAMVTGRAAPATALEPPPDSAGFARLSTVIQGLMTRDSVLGLAIAVIDGPRVAWSAGFGYTSRARTGRVTARTLFSVQSVTKTYTATAVLRAVERGELRLDDPLVLHLPGFTVRSRFSPDDYRRITLRQLLSHWAGLAHEAPVGNNMHDCRCAFPDHARSIAASWLVARPGERYWYSNLGYDLLGYALSIRAGKSFAQLIRDEVLAPLGMRASTVEHAIATRGSWAVGQVGGADAPDQAIPMEAAGGLYSSVLDMAKYVMMHLARGQAGGRAYLQPATLDSMYVPQFPVDHQEGGYGLGVIRRRAFGAWMITHGGGGYGYTTEQRWIPEYGVGVVVLTNDGDVGNAAGEAADSAITLLIDRKFGRRPQDRPPVLTTLPRYHPTLQELERLAGSYRAYSGRRTFRIVGETLVIESGGGRRDLTAHSATEFTTADERFRFEVVHGRAQRVHNLGPNGVDTFILNDWPGQPSGPALPQWQQYAGDYQGYAYGRPVVGRIFMQNGYLYSSRGGGTRLEPYTDGLFFGVDGESFQFDGARLLMGNRPLLRLE